MTSAHEDEQQPPQTANDAVVYVRTVKLRFNGDQGHVYEAFLDVMRDFKSGRCVFLFRSCFKGIIAPQERRDISWIERRQAPQIVFFLLLAAFI